MFFPKSFEFLERGESGLEVESPRLIVLFAGTRFAQGLNAQKFETLFAEVRFDHLKQLVAETTSMEGLAKSPALRCEFNRR